MLMLIIHISYRQVRFYNLLSLFELNPLKYFRFYTFSTQSHQTDQFQPEPTSDFSKLERFFLAPLLGANWDAKTTLKFRKIDLQQVRKVVALRKSIPTPCVHIYIRIPIVLFSGFQRPASARALSQGHFGPFMSFEASSALLSS